MDGTQHEVREKEMSASIRMLEVAPIGDKGKRNCLRWFQSCRPLNTPLWRKDLM